MAEELRMRIDDGPGRLEQLANRPTPARAARSLMVAAAVGALGLGCGDDSTTAPPISMVTAGGTSPGNPTGAATSATGFATETGPGDGTAATSGGVTNCGELLCGDHGSCVINDMGGAACACDPGYLNDDDVCVVDETCIQVRFLEDGCRQFINGAPAVALFFGVDFCSGTAVTPAKRAELGLTFQILENGKDIAKNFESDAQIVDATVENYVMLVVDVSDSVTQGEFLPALVTELRSLVTDLAPAQGEPQLYVAVTVFARDVAEYVPFTADLSVVDAALAALAVDPSFAVDLAGGGAGTELFRATKKSLIETSRIRDLRDVVTRGGVLSTGTVVVITDGNNSTNSDLDTTLIEATLNQVISIGISGDIDDEQLAAVGRDGSFLAPTPELWVNAFDEIATRVQEYPERSYLLAYCSSATTGVPLVEVSVQGQNLGLVTTAACGYNAGLFSGENIPCSAALFDNECNAKECGGLTACGACDDAECCTGSTCVGPMTATQAQTPCTGQPDLCYATDQVCDDLAGVCVEPTPLGGECVDDRCTPHAAYCAANEECTDARGLGTSCEDREECDSLNCYYPKPENIQGGKICLPEARIGQICGNTISRCEPGAFCAGGVCTARLREASACNGDLQCRNANCQATEVGNFCDGPPACYWAWDEKLIAG